MFLLHGQSEASQLSWVRCSLIALGGPGRASSLPRRRQCCRLLLRPPWRRTPSAWPPNWPEPASPSTSCAQAGHRPASAVRLGRRRHQLRGHRLQRQGAHRRPGPEPPRLPVPAQVTASHRRDRSAHEEAGPACTTPVNPRARNRGPAGVVWAADWDWSTVADYTCVTDAPPPRIGAFGSAAMPASPGCQRFSRGDGHRSPARIGALTPSDANPPPRARKERRRI